eukprot:5609981-Pleurochrysis_carterae.AAC.2
MDTTRMQYIDHGVWSDGTAALFGRRAFRTLYQLLVAISPFSSLIVHALYIYHAAFGPSSAGSAFRSPDLIESSSTCVCKAVAAAASANPRLRAFLRLPPLSHAVIRIQEEHVSNYEILLGAISKDVIDMDLSHISCVFAIWMKTADA